MGQGHQRPFLSYVLHKRTRNERQTSNTHGTPQNKRRRCLKHYTRSVNCEKFRKSSSKYNEMGPDLRGELERRSKEHNHSHTLHSVEWSKVGNAGACEVFAAAASKRLVPSMPARSTSILRTPIFRITPFLPSRCYQTTVNTTRSLNKMPALRSRWSVEKRTKWNKLSVSITYIQRHAKINSIFFVIIIVLFHDIFR